MCGCGGCRRCMEAQGFMDDDYCLGCHEPWDECVCSQLDRDPDELEDRHEAEGGEEPQEERAQ